MSIQSSHDIERTGGGIEVTLHAAYGDMIDGWQEAREDLGFNGGGPDAVDGVEIVDEDVHYYDDDKREHIAGYGPVTLKFADVDALSRARERLLGSATERFEWGDADGPNLSRISPVVCRQNTLWRRRCRAVMPMSKEDLRDQLDSALKQAVADGLTADEIEAVLNGVYERLDKIRALEGDA